MNEDAFEVPERTEYRYLVQEEEGGEEVQYVRHRHYINPLLVLSRRCVVLVCFGVLALLTLATYLGYLAQTLPPGVAVVTTHCGKFRGRHVSPKTYRKKTLNESSPLPLKLSPFCRVARNMYVCYKF